MKSVDRFVRKKWLGALKGETLFNALVLLRIYP
jgi:hypothetical protein